MSKPVLHSRVLTILLLLLIGNGLTAWLFAYDLSTTTNWFKANAGVVWGRDFANLWTGGQIWWAGDYARLYDTAFYQQQMAAFFGTLNQHSYSYPPTNLFLSAFLGWMPYPVAYGVWVFGTALLFLLAARPYLGKLNPVIAILSPAATLSIWAGQYGLLFGAIWLWTMRSLEKQQMRAGAGAAIMLIKPHLALALPLLFAWKRRWKETAIAAAGIVVLVAASSLISDATLWQDYLFKVTEQQSRIMHAPDTEFYFTLMPTTYVALAGWPPLIRWGAQIATAIYALAALWTIRNGSIAELGFAASTATLLILPYAFGYDMTVACLGYLILLYQKWEGLSVNSRIILSMGFLLPELVHYLKVGGVPIAPLILVAVLYVQAQQSLRKASVINQLPARS